MEMVISIWQQTFLTSNINMCHLSHVDQHVLADRINDTLTRTLHTEEGRYIIITLDAIGKETFELYERGNDIPSFGLGLYYLLLYIL